MGRRRRGGPKKKAPLSKGPLPPPPEVTPEDLTAFRRQGAPLLAIFPAELWEMIFQEVRPEDRENISNASLFFRHQSLSLRADFLFPSVLPVLVHKAYVFKKRTDIAQGAADLLRFRRVSRTWNSGVVALCQDRTPNLEFLEQKRTGQVGPWKHAIIRKLDTSYVLRQADVARFLDHFRPTHGPTENPFLSRTLSLSLVTRCPSKDHPVDPEAPQFCHWLNLLDQYGRQVAHLKVLVAHHCPLYQKIYIHLASILRRARHLRTLELGYPNTPRHRGSEYYDIPGAPAFDLVDRDLPARPAFKRLEHLALFYVPACILTRVCVHSTNLTELTIKSEEDWSAEQLTTILGPMTQLQILWLDLRKTGDSWKLDFLAELQAVQSLTLTLGVSSRSWDHARPHLLTKQGHKFRFLDFFDQDGKEGQRAEKHRARGSFELWPDLKVYTFKLAMMWGEGEAVPEPPGFRRTLTKCQWKQQEARLKRKMESKVDVKVIN